LPVFEIKKKLYAGIDGIICKITLLAKNAGYVHEDHFLGVQIRVKPACIELQNEVKRIGYIRDRERPIELRVGDTLIAYISKTTA